MNPIRLLELLPRRGVLASACVAMPGLAACGGGGDTGTPSGTGSTAVL